LFVVISILVALSI